MIDEVVCYLEKLDCSSRVQISRINTFLGHFLESFSNFLKSLVGHAFLLSCFYDPRLRALPQCTKMGPDFCWFLVEG